MSNFIARAVARDAVVIDRTPRSRSVNADTVGMVISLLFLGAMSVAYLYLEGFLQ